MNNRQREALAKFLADWHEKFGIGCLLVGMFQEEHIIGGVIGSIACFIVALTINVWRAK